MACACKNAKQLNNMIPNNNHNKYDKKGFKFFINLLWSLFLSLVNRIIVILLFIIITPIVIVVLIFNYLFQGELILGIPNYIYKKIMNYKNG